MPDVAAHVYDPKKHSKASVGFEHPSTGENHCGDCKYFEVLASRHCQIVSGIIEASDWCKKFKEKVK